MFVVFPMTKPRKIGTNRAHLQVCLLAFHFFVIWEIQKKQILWFHLAVLACLFWLTQGRCPRWTYLENKNERKIGLVKCGQ